MILNDVVIAGQNWSNSAQVLKEYYQVEIFFRLDNTLPLLPDSQIIASSDYQIQMQFVKIQGNNFALFYITKENVRLEKGTIGGVPLIATMEMVLGVPTINGILLQSDKDAWIAIKKEELLNLLNNKNR
jgi:hypothetical protein